MKAMAWRALAAAGACSFTALAAHAQTSSTAAVADATELEEVTITGSRVITNGNDAPTPVTVVTVEDMLTTKPTTVFEGLAELPAFAGSRGVSQGATNSGLGDGNAVAALNLRNLGVLRTLVLYDGKRVPPTTADGIVNTNVLPQMLLQRVDVVTGGASAVYGSDAVTGVVNFITDRRFNGVKVQLQRGISTYGDDPSYEVGIAGGLDLFGGRGHFEASYQRHYDAGILIRSKSDRKWLEPLWTLQGDGSAALPWHLQQDVRITAATYGGRIVCPNNNGLTAAQCLLPGNVQRPLVGQTFDDNGLLSPFQNGPTGSSAGLSNSTIQIGADGSYHDWPSLKSGSKLDQVFARFDFDITDNLHAYVQASGALDYTIGHTSNLRSFGAGWFLGACNAFLAQQYRTALGCTNQNDANQPVFRLSKMFTSNSPGEPGGTVDSYARNYFAIAGLEGNFGDGYRWDAAYTHSKSSTNVRAHKLHHMGELFASLDAVVDPSTGQIVCNVTLTNPGLYPGCVPINLFGPTAASAEAINYIFGRIEFEATNKLDSISGSIAGSPFATWAGPLDAALSGEFRRQTYELWSSSLPTDIIGCAGLRFGNCTSSSTRWLNSWAPRSPVEQQAMEAAVEFNAPLLNDKPIVNALDLNAAARYTRYDNDPGKDPVLVGRSINAATWKAGLTWDISDSLTVRWARSRDMRAPNLFDLYTPVSVTPNSITVDYLQPGTPITSPTAESGGNPFLDPEVSHTTTLGVVWRPTAELSVSLDAYDISIKDALASINGAARPVQEACYASGGASPLCDLQERPFGFSNTSPANAMTKVYNRRINVAEQVAQGIDMEINYKTQLAGNAFSVRALANYQPHLIYSQPPLNSNDQAGASFNPTYGLPPSPVWRASLFLHYNITESLAVNVSERWRSRLKWTADPTQYSIGGVPSVAYTNFNLSYGVASELGQFNVYLNVQNLFNRAPPPAGNPTQQFQPGLTSNGFAWGDDVVGRYYSFGIRARF